MSDVSVIKFENETYTIKDQMARRLIESLNSKTNAMGNGSPLIAASTAEMTNTSKIYVNTTDGKWYFHNGNSWVAGGTYQATSVDYIKNQFYENNIGYIDNNKNVCNIFNPHNSYDGYFQGSDGSFSEHEWYATTDYLSVNGGADLIIGEYGDNIFFGFYDVNKKWIERIVNVNSLTIPENASYVRIGYVKARKSEIEIYEGSAFPSNKYYYTNFIRNNPVIKNTPHAKLMRGSITIKSIDNINKTITLNVAANTIIYCENEFAVVNAGEYTISNNEGIFVNAKTGNIENQTLTLKRIGETNIFNGLYFLGYMSDCVVFHDNFKPFEVNKTGFLTYEKISDAVKLTNLFIYNNKKTILYD